MLLLMQIAENQFKAFGNKTEDLGRSAQLQCSIIYHLSPIIYLSCCFFLLVVISNRGMPPARPSPIRSLELRGVTPLRNPSSSRSGRSTPPSASYEATPCMQLAAVTYSEDIVPQARLSHRSALYESAIDKLNWFLNPIKI